MTENKAKILIVDDEELIRTIYTSILSPHYTTEEAIDGRQAIEILIKKGDPEYFDLVISDINMPNIDGLRLTDFVNQKFPMVAILVISANTNRKVLTELLRNGVCDFIEKPFKPAEMEEAVKSILDKNNLRNSKTRMREMYKDLGSKVEQEVGEHKQELNEWLRGGMLHFFNQPLTVINGSEALLGLAFKKGTFDESTSKCINEALGDIKSATSCLSDLIKKISRIGSLETEEYLDTKIFNPHISLSRSFARCNCGAMWKTRQDFLSDKSIAYEGYSADLEKYEFGFFTFNHACENDKTSTISISVMEFADMFGATNFEENIACKDECSALCTDASLTGICNNSCRNAKVREAIQKIISTDTKE